VASLCKKYQRAKAAVGTMNQAATELGGTINNKAWILQWEELENLARTERGEALMIYNVAQTSGKRSDYPPCHTDGNHQCPYNMQGRVPQQMKELTTSMPNGCLMEYPYSWSSRSW
jgi:hypothetical protein